MWRPDNWETERNIWLNTVGGKFADSGEIMEASVIYEAGADAMLKRLEAMGDYKTPCEELWLGDDMVTKTQIPGWLVFIPSEA